MLRFLWCPSRQQKLGEHSKECGDLEKVGNRIVAIGSINTCVSWKIVNKNYKFF